MDINSYSYVIVAAALGMGIVFLFLWFLSGLMSLITFVFGERAGKSDGDSTEAAAPGVPAARKSEGNEWVVAAVAAFLEAEELDQTADPAPWVARRSHHEDPWLTAGSTRKL